MVGVKFSMLAAGALALTGTVVIGAATAHADDAVGGPSSLRMRSHAPDKRVAQAPIPDQPNEDSITPDDPDPLSATPQVAPAPTVTVTPALTVRDLAPRRGAAAILVTGSLIERATRITPSPMTILTRDDLLAAGRTMIGDI